MSEGVARANPADARAATAGLDAHELFSPQEESFLRHYAENLSRLQAMIAAGYASQAPDIREQQALMAKAGELIARAGRLSLSAICSAIGGDRIAYCAMLWRYCQRDDNPHNAIKALMLMGRIHGLYDKHQPAPQVALIFAQPATPPGATPPGATPPPDLPFMLSSGDYRLFQPAENENKRAG